MKALLLIVFAAAFIAASPAWGESLMDIKADELNRPIKTKWGKDPFLRFEDRDRIQTGARSPLPEFIVEGIMADSDKALAIIDGGFYRKGDTLGDFIVEDILADRVVLKRSGRSYMLRIRGFAVQGPATEDGQ